MTGLLAQIYTDPQVNVLIDEAANALLCDFGLSRLHADVRSRSVRENSSKLVGSRNWMSPERIKGGAVKPPGDIYAFGMTIFEVQPTQLL
jgi:serine/threonine protein kinase